MRMAPHLRQIAGLKAQNDGDPVKDDRSFSQPDRRHPSRERGQVKENSSFLQEIRGHVEPDRRHPQDDRSQVKENSSFFKSTAVILRLTGAVLRLTGVILKKIAVR